MNIHFQFIASLFAMIPLFIPFQVEYIDALDFDNDSVEQNILPYLNTIKNENYKKQKIDFANTIENNAEIEHISKIVVKTNDENDKDNSDKSTEKDTLNEIITSYYNDKGIGIKLENSTPWTINAKSDKSICANINSCFLYLGIINKTDMPQLWIIEDRFESQTITDYCKCNTLEDYVSHIYNNMISQFDNFSFINQNQATISGDRPAIQIEYEFSPNDTKIHTFTIFTQDNNSFYQFSYYGDSETYLNYLADFEKLINTIELTS
jgi:hypothetical protein